MNILRIIANMNPSSGGPCQGIRNSIPELEKLGVRSEVVCLDNPTALYLKEDAFPVYALGQGKGPWCYNAKLVPWLLANFSRFDAVIVHGLWLYPSYAALKAICRYRQEKRKVPKFYIMPHGMLDPYFQKAPERRLKALRNQIYWKLIEEKVINKADGVLFTCEEELQLAKKTFHPYQPKREIKVGYGIAIPPPYKPCMLAEFSKKCPRLGTNPYLLFLSRIHKKKGVDILLNAYAALLQGKGEKREEVPRLVIAGPGLETAYGHMVQQMVNESPFLRSSVFFPGMLTGDAKWGAFRRCDAFVLPSHQENFGIAVVEALACGRPVLISNQVNIWREIKGDGSGMVAQDSLEGIQQMLEAWGDKSIEEKKEFSQNAMETFTKRFSIGPAAKQLLEAIEN